VEDDDDLSTVAGVERAARDLEFDYVHGFAERYQTPTESAPSPGTTSERSATESLQTV
jgi:hypothetical protein